MSQSKPKAPAEPAAPTSDDQGAREGTIPPASTTAAPEGPDSPSISLSLAVGVGGPDGDPGPAPLGELPAYQPEIPTELDARLNGRERRTVWHMVAGLDYQQALTACGVPPRAAVRDQPIPPHIDASVRAVLVDISVKAGLSRQWIIAQTVGLYRRASQAEDVLDRRGRPTGVYRFDGATAAKCLTMLAEWNGQLNPKRAGIAPSDVAALLRAVADRGRPPLQLDRARAHSPAAQQEEKT